MSFLFDPTYYEVKKNGLSPAQNMAAYLGGSAIQTVGDNPVTAYRQLVQQYAKGLDGVTVDPRVAQSEANAVFRTNPVGASLSGLWPRLIGVLFKRVPKFGILLGYSAITGDTGDPGFQAATAASILSAPFINPVRMVEKQQRAFLKQTGVEKPLMEILREAGAKNFAPLFRGTIPLMGALHFRLHQAACHRVLCMGAVGARSKAAKLRYIPPCQATPSRARPWAWWGSRSCRSTSRAS